VHQGRPQDTVASRDEVFGMDRWHQLRDYRARAADHFTLIWYIARRPHGMTVLTRFALVSFLYGTKSLDGYDRSGVFYEKPCFFLRRGLFQRYADLDAVIVQDDPDVTLCLNPLSKRALRFRDTRLANVLSETMTVVDPAQMEAAGQAFLVDQARSSASLNDKVAFLKAHYGLDTVTIWSFGIYNYPVE
jgi:hypothetical protein